MDKIKDTADRILYKGGLQEKDDEFNIDVLFAIFAYLLFCVVVHYTKKEGLFMSFLHILKLP